MTGGLTPQLGGGVYDPSEVEGGDPPTLTDTNPNKETDMIDYKTDHLATLIAADRTFLCDIFTNGPGLLEDLLSWRNLVLNLDQGFEDKWGELTCDHPWLNHLDQEICWWRPAHDLLSEWCDAGKDMIGNVADFGDFSADDLLEETLEHLHEDLKRRPEFAEHVKDCMLKAVFNPQDPKE